MKAQPSRTADGISCANLVPRMEFRYVRFVLAAVLCVIATASAHAHRGAPRAAHAVADGAPFQFNVAARAALQELWQSSSDAKQEEVACIGGYRRGGVSYITRVVRVRTSADSMNASAMISIRECGAPEWLGTVHTHIARFGGLPYVTFSAPDRGVMREWHNRWKADGVFCVLYDDQHAYCEAGDENGGDALYAYPRGNNLGS
jgi:hypothetical protein